VLRAHHCYSVFFCSLYDSLETPGERLRCGHFLVVRDSIAKKVFMFGTPTQLIP
jgi:hypothetical protein